MSLVKIVSAIEFLKFKDLKKNHLTVSIFPIVHVMYTGFIF